MIKFYEANQAGSVDYNEESGHTADEMDEVFYFFETTDINECKEKIKALKKRIRIIRKGASE